MAEQQPNSLYSSIFRRAPEVPDVSERMPTVAEKVSDITEKTADVAEKVSQTITGSVSSGVQSVKDFSGKYGVTIFVAILLAVIIFFVAYLLYTYISGVISNKILWIVPESKVPNLGMNYSRLSGDGIPTKLNGRRMTFMFWIYIHDLNKNAGSYRHILHRGDQTIEGASPLVMMDKTLNKLYIRFAGTKETQLGNWDMIVMNAKKMLALPDGGCSGPNGTCTSAEEALVNGITDETAILYDLATHGIVVDYVPLQRWVQVAVVVNESINQGSMSLFMDGELVKSHTSSEYFLTPTGQRVYYNFQNLNLDKKGDIWIGGDTNASGGLGFSGLIGKVSFTNYDMNTSEVYKEYLTGPINNLTSKMGLPAYGLRSPVYRIG